MSPNHCRQVSTSDSFTPIGRTTLGVTWELTVIADGEERSLFSNRVTVTPTDDYRDLLDRHRIPLERGATTVVTTGPAGRRLTGRDVRGLDD